MQACGETLDIMKNDLAAYYLFVEKKIIILKHFRISRKTEKKFYEISIARLTRVHGCFLSNFPFLREKNNFFRNFMAVLKAIKPIGISQKCFHYEYGKGKVNLSRRKC